MRSAQGEEKFGPGFARNVVVLNIEVSTIYTLLDKKIKTSTSFALKRRANTRSEVIKVRFSTKMHFLLDITPFNYICCYCFDHFSLFYVQECKDGRRQVIAIGCIDLADYISQTNKTFDMTVTLKPAMKNVLSGTMEFNLTSVMLEDGIP